MPSRHGKSTQRRILVSERVDNSTTHAQVRSQVCIAPAGLSQFQRPRAATELGVPDSGYNEKRACLAQRCKQSLFLPDNARTAGYHNIGSYVLSSGDEAVPTTVQQSFGS